jgi:hypothetical protein
MLEHTGGEEHRAKLIERGDECLDEGRPSTRKRQGLPAGDAMARTRTSPDPIHATGVEPSRQGQSQEHDGLPVPNTPDFPRRQGLAVSTSEGCPSNGVDPQPLAQGTAEHGYRPHTPPTPPRRM